MLITKDFVSVTRRLKMSEYVNKPIQVTSIEEHEDGSATVQVECDPETFAAIFNVGFVQLIENGLKGEENVRSNV